MTNHSQSAYDAAVIGAGVFGSWIAYRLAQSGYSVVLLDAYGPGNPRSTSGGESRIIRMSYGDNEVYTRFSYQSLSMWKEIAGLFIPTGVLWLAPSDNTRFQACVETLLRLDIPFQHLNEPEIRERYPQMALPPGTTAILEPESGALLARKAVLAVVERARALGTEVMLDAAISLDTDGSTVITSSGRHIPGSTLIFACGPWLPKLFPALLEDVITSTRQELFFFGPPAGVREQMPAWLDDTDARLPYVLPDVDGSGVKLGFHREGPRFDPDSGDRLVNPQQVEEAKQYIGERFPSLAGAPLVGSRVCQYENTPTGDFLIDRHPDFANVWLVGGGSGHGFKHGPAVADYVLGQIEARAPQEPRFALSAHSAKYARTVF